MEDLTPSKADRGIVTEESRQSYGRIIQELTDQGAQAIILGCTEIGILIKEAACPLYDSTVLHSLAAARESLK